VELTEVMRTAGSVRRFSGQPVTDETVYRILEQARFAPSGGNRQPWHVTVVRDAAIRRSVRDLYVLGWREYSEHVALNLVPFAPSQDGSWHGPVIDLARAREVEHPDAFGDHLDEVPLVLVVSVALPGLAVTDNGLPRQSVVGGASIYPFVHNILLAARDNGLGGVITTVICRQEEAVRDLLHLPQAEAVAALMALGYPERTLTRLSRKPVEEFATIDRRDGPPLRAADSSLELPAAGQAAP
jgi:nitroreductase